MDNWAVVDWTKDVWHFVVRMLIAIICGLAIGFERKSRSKEAGIRTHAIVCLASCLFMILSKYLAAPIFSDIAGNKFDGDATRIASQVVTGIGFLGAGIIMYRRDVMHGLTTAAGVWATAAIGMAIGSGFAYYSLSSLLIVQFKEAAIGLEMATQLGTIALLANIIREMLTMKFCRKSWRN